MFRFMSEFFNSQVAIIFYLMPSLLILNTVASNIWVARKFESTKEFGKKGDSENYGATVLACLKNLVQLAALRTRLNTPLILFVTLCWNLLLLVLLVLLLLLILLLLLMLILLWLDIDFYVANVFIDIHDVIILASEEFVAASQLPVCQLSTRWPPGTISNITLPLSYGQTDRHWQIPWLRCVSNCYKLLCMYHITCAY